MGGAPPVRGLDRTNRLSLRWRRRRPTPKQDGERGAVLVEAAFTLVILLMLLLGTVTAGLAYGQSNALQTAAREGSRFGATFTNAETDLATVLAVTEAAAAGDLAGGVPGRYICVALVGHAPEVEGAAAGTGGPLADRCFADGRPDDEERIQVVVERTATINAVIFTTDITLRSESAARYER